MAQLYRMEFTPELALDAQLRQLGYALEDISYVVPSHLHFDHAGGLYLFPDATFFVGAGELGYAYWPPPGHRRAFLVADLLPTRDFDWVELGADHDLFGDGSIVILSTPGHTPGEVSLLVRLPSRTLILTGDTCHFCMELDRGMAAVDIPCSDPAQASRSIRRIRSMRRSLPAEVWVGHDPDHWAQFPHAPEALV
ncbi:MAG: N-acyl homoserine lactonase family protein [Actinobacteria bacterium]|nr:MAG: N-acyl homoserine lactonase family protein [Actinomycetota bacterium]